MLHALSGLVDDVAALYVDRNGPYPSRVQHWYDDKRDARSYTDELPIVAHPPCQRWCRLAGLVEARWGHKKGADGGLFEHALATVRRVGGVLEHPAYSDAWAAFGLPRPVTGGEWTPGALAYEWTCYVEQWRYGHRAKKATWLYYRGFRKPFALKWGCLADRECRANDVGLISWAGNEGKPHHRDRPEAVWRGKTREQRGTLSDPRPHNDNEPLLARPTHLVGYNNNNGGRLHLPRLTKKQSKATPPEFLDVLIELARWSSVPELRMQPSMCMGRWVRTS